MIDTEKNFNKEYLMRNIMIVLLAFPAMADEYLGKLSANPYSPDSTSSEYSSDSINNPYGAGSPYRADSPNNRYGEGLSIYGDDDG